MRWGPGGEGTTDRRVARRGGAGVTEVRAEPVLELDGVTKAYPGSPPVVALDRVDLAIHSGDLLAIVGPSGSGKSTLLHVMGTLDRPSAGAVRIEGRDVTGCSDTELSRLRARTIGFVS